MGYLTMTCAWNEVVGIGVDVSIIKNLTYIVRISKDYVIQNKSDLKFCFSNLYNSKFLLFFVIDSRS